MNHDVRGPVRELTAKERMQWGTCPVCKAMHGDACNSLVGFQLGVSASGGRINEGVHLARIQAAPMKVQERGVAWAHPTRKSSS